MTLITEHAADLDTLQVDIDYQLRFQLGDPKLDHFHIHAARARTLSEWAQDSFDEDKIAATRSYLMESINHNRLALLALQRGN